MTHHMHDGFLSDKNLPILTEDSKLKTTQNICLHGKCIKSFTRFVWIRNPRL